MDKIDEKMVRHMAFLARIEMNPSEVDSYKRDLGRVLKYMDQLKQVDTDNVPRLFSNEDSYYREDDILPSLPVEDILRNAPSVHSGQFKVEGVLESE